MSSKAVAELRVRVCDSDGCWRTQVLTDANVSANLGGPWRILRLDHHFSECVPPKDTVGELCDGVATYPQNTNDKLKLIELKQSLDDLSKAKRQLRKGGARVRNALSSGFQGLTVEAELHVKHAPITTRKTRDELDIGGLRVPLLAFRNGKRV